jgi:hypothetical protein
MKDQYRRHPGSSATDRLAMKPSTITDHPQMKRCTKSCALLAILSSHFLAVSYSILKLKINIVYLLVRTAFEYNQYISTKLACTHKLRIARVQLYMTSNKSFYGPSTQRD